jgi:hypothetical protein
MKINQEDFERKAQHIVDTVVKPQVERYEQAKAIEEAAANYLHRVADGKRCTGYADEDFIEGAKWQQEQAKEMEKVKIINTLVEFSKAHFDIHTEEAISYITKKAEKYYNKHFKQEQ